MSKKLSPQIIAQAFRQLLAAQGHTELEIHAVADALRERSDLDTSELILTMRQRPVAILPHLVTKPQAQVDFDVQIRRYAPGTSGLPEPQPLSKALRAAAGRAKLTPAPTNLSLEDLGL
jgi:hypothetical protein